MNVDEVDPFDAARARLPSLDSAPRSFARGDLLAHLCPHGFGHAGQAAESFETGTPPDQALAGLTAASGYIESIGWDGIAADEHELATRVLERILAGYTAHGLAFPEGRTATFALTSTTLSTAELAGQLAAAAIGVRVGGFHAPLTLERLGLEAVRSAACTTTLRPRSSDCSMSSPTSPATTKGGVR